MHNWGIRCLFSWTSQLKNWGILRLQLQSSSAKPGFQLPPNNESREIDLLKFLYVTDQFAMLDIVVGFNSLQLSVIQYGEGGPG
jgi:hypothetical protein